MGRECGLMRRQGRLDAPDRASSTGVMGSYAIVGAHLPIAAGAALAAQYRGTEQVAVCFFGDGATNIGAFHEALNFAAVWKLPVIFVCENNLYMEYTPIARGDRRRAPGGRPRRARTACEQVVIDGNDADDVYATASEAIDAARAGGGPALIEAHDLSAQRPLARRSGEVPARGRARGVDEAGPARCSTATACSSSASPRPTLEGPGDEAMRKVDEATEAAKASPLPALDVDRQRRLGRRRCGMAELTYRDAVAAGIAQEMARDERVVLLGEDIAAAGGVFKATVGLLEQFGPKRVRDTPISEQAILGAAMGAAMTGLAPDRRDHVLGLPRRSAGTTSRTRSPRRAT